MPSASGMGESAARPPSLIADDPSALPSPTSSPYSSQLFLPVHSMPDPVCQMLYYTIVLLKVQHNLNVLFLCLFLMYFYVKSINILNLLQYSTTNLIVLLGYLSMLDLQTNQISCSIIYSWNGTPLYIRVLLYRKHGAMNVLFCVNLKCPSTNLSFKSLVYNQ